MIKIKETPFRAAIVDFWHARTPQWQPATSLARRSYVCCFLFLKIQPKTKPWLLASRGGPVFQGNALVSQIPCKIILWQSPAFVAQFRRVPTIQSDDRLPCRRFNPGLRLCEGNTFGGAQTRVLWVVEFVDLYICNYC